MSVDIDKLVEQLAKPIIDRIKRMDDSELQKYWNQVPQIHVVRDHEVKNPIVIDGVEVDDEFIEKLEAYVQKELETLEKPTTFH